jgi:hypothetical protein
MTSNPESLYRSLLLLLFVGAITAFLYVFLEVKGGFLLKNHWRICLFGGIGGSICDALIETVFSYNCFGSGLSDKVQKRIRSLCRGFWICVSCLCLTMFPKFFPRNYCFSTSLRTLIIILTLIFISLICAIKDKKIGKKIKESINIIFIMFSAYIYFGTNITDLLKDLRFP